MSFEYSRVYVNLNLPCVNCWHPFFTVETSAPSINGSSKYTPFSRSSCRSSIRFIMQDGTDFLAWAHLPNFLGQMHFMDQQVTKMGHCKLLSLLELLMILIQPVKHQEKPQGVKDRYQDGGKPTYESSFSKSIRWFRGYPSLSSKEWDAAGISSNSIKEPPHLGIQNIISDEEIDKKNTGNGKDAQSKNSNAHKSAEFVDIKSRIQPKMSCIADSDTDPTTMGPEPVSMSWEVLYRNLSSNWKTLRPDEVIHKRDMVEVLEAYNELDGVAVGQLVKVPGFIQDAKRKHSGPSKTLVIQELFRFSHQLPSDLLTGQEGHNSQVLKEHAAKTVEVKEYRIIIVFFSSPRRWNVACGTGQKLQTDGIGKTHFKAIGSSKLVFLFSKSQHGLSKI
ncbi:hypothetical protein F3Y22_tig00110469pilonHSYRG00264 [Hibiscus syriacus]|uniref:DUF3444 domain-containing protein n=1 Tax=Hibiscus syriacus TaxID=106335 RepID=A0A6A3AL45_HIBSY|nr:hypothetical protein F3Y22_tig00110469pilonHSYRG00264 [Hibiscus syriacus]